MAAYSERHYGERTWRLRNPRVIVEHVAIAGTAAAVHNTFAPDHPDPELHELPNVCSHFVVNSAGRIFRLVNLRTRCRHTVGLNWTAIGIEHTGFSDGDVLGDRRQMRASLRLTQYLRCRFDIGVRNVIGHNESLSSPFRRELVPSLRNQTHEDWRHASMRSTAGACGGSAAAEHSRAARYYPRVMPNTNPLRVLLSALALALAGLAILAGPAAANDLFTLDANATSPGRSSPTPGAPPSSPGPAGRHLRCPDVLQDPRRRHLHQPGDALDPGRDRDQR